MKFKTMSVEESCRACMKQEGIMYSLYEMYDEDVTLSSLLKNYLNVEVHPDDGLPKTFCTECTSAVIGFHNFAVIFQDSEAILQEALYELKKNSNKDSNEKNESIIIATIDEEPISTEEENDKSNKLIKDNKNNCDIETGVLKIDEEKKKEEEILLLVGDDEEKITRYHCKECDDIFLSEELFRKHMQKKHQKEDIKPNEFCTIIYIKNCDKSKSNCEQEEKVQEIIVEKEKPYICEVCGRAFAKKSYLNDHRASHSEFKQFECKFCLKRFRRRTVLAKHLKIHTCPKGRMCEICGQSFTDSSTLSTHQQLKHINGRKFACDLCGMTFNLKSTLDKHIFRHQRQNTDKNFICTICNMKYYDKSSLKRHYDHKHNDDKKPLVCRYCGKAYASKTNLNKHFRIHNINT